MHYPYLSQFFIVLLFVNVFFLCEFYSIASGTDAEAFILALILTSSRVGPCGIGHACYNKGGFCDAS